MTERRRFIVHQDGRARTRMSSGERVATKSPRARGNVSFGRQFDRSRIQMPATSTLAPISGVCASAGNALTSTVTGMPPELTWKRPPSVRLRTVPAMRTALP